jgi:anthranilate/para-aminobenzoate synthase component I
MAAQDVERVAGAAWLLGDARRAPGAVLLDGGGVDSWGDGRVLYTDSPSATLAVRADGWACWRRGGRKSWRRAPPLAQWEDFVAAAGTVLPAGGDPGAAGILTLLSYDLKHWIEHLPRRHSWPDGPILYSALYDWHYAGARGTDGATIRASTPPDLDRLLRRRDALPREPFPRSRSERRLPCPKPRTSKADYVAMVERAREFIAAGDIYQVNLAQSFFLPAPLDPRDLFLSWCGGYPAPFAAYVDAGDRTIVSNSPECLLRLDGRRVSTFPIKGTRAAAASADLAGDPKERAEHLMIVDLERSDLGRVCETASVEVAVFGEVRSYPLLAHMVSEVRGRLRPDVSLAALFGAVFPGGSVTGAPKVRAMEIIEELEPCARGIYTGAIGWMSPDGQGCFNLPIRTAVVTPAGVRYDAGGGIVADSEPEREYEESLLKAETFFRALAALGRTP